MRWTLVEYFAGRGNVSQMFRNEPGQYVCPYELLDHECMDFNSDPGFALLSLLLMPWVETCLQASHCFGASKRAGGIALDGPSVFELDTHKSREFVEIIYELLRGPFQRLCELCDVCKFNDLEALLKHIDRVRAQGRDHYALQHCRAWQLPLRAACWLWGCVPEPPTAFMAVQSCGCGSLAKRSNQVGVSLVRSTGTRFGWPTMARKARRGQPFGASERSWCLRWSATHDVLLSGDLPRTKGS